MQKQRTVTNDDWQLLHHIASTAPSQQHPDLAALLRPERDAKLISDHDLQIMQNEMFWVNRVYRQYRFPMNAFLAANAGYLVHKYRNTAFRALPRQWRWVPTALASAVAYGFVEFDSMVTDYAFEKRLDDPRAVHQSFRNLQARLSHPQGQATEAEELWRNTDPHNDDVVSSSSSREVNPDSAGVRNPSRTPPQQSQTARVPRTRWDDIRANSARNATRTSSWDALRETHQRERMAQSTTAVNAQDLYDPEPERENAD